MPSFYSLATVAFISALCLFVLYVFLWSTELVLKVFDLKKNEVDSIIQSGIMTQKDILAVSMKLCICNVAQMFRNHYTVWRQGNGPAIISGVHAELFRSHT